MIFYFTALVAITTSLLVVLCRHPVHALVYLILSLLSVAMLLFLLGARFAAALEVIVYAGAIMMLFVFVMMMLRTGHDPLPPKSWIAPFLCTLLLLTELICVIRQPAIAHIIEVEPQQVSLSLFGPYALGVEMAAFLLLTGLMGAYYLGKKEAE